jgi:hypothetical protein
VEAMKAIREAMTSIGQTRLVFRPLTGDLFDDDMVLGIPCLCVQDSPENPCRCPAWPIIAFPRALVLAEGESDRSAEDGEQLLWADLARDSRIVLLSATSLPVGAFRAAIEAREGRQVPGWPGSRIDEMIRYMAAYWQYVLYDAWGPLPERPPEPPPR